MKVRAWRQVLLGAWAVFLLGLWCVAIVRAFAPLLRWQVSDTVQRGQLSVHNARPKGGYYGMPVTMGDLDGDGKLDLVLGPMGAASGPQGERPQAGEVYVYRGDASIAGTIDRRTMGDTPLGLTVWGARTDDFLGVEVHTGDVDGDGIADLVIGAQNYDGPDGTRDNCGGVFVVLGRPGLLGAPGQGGLTIDLAAPPDRVITIVGRRPGDRLGIWARAGDIDGDGLADILVGADQSSGPDPLQAKTHAGMVAVIYGRKTFPPVVDLAGEGGQAVPGVSLIYGRNAEDHFGSTLHERDLDRDGRSELIISAALNRLSASYGGTDTRYIAHPDGAGSGPGNVRPQCGDVFVIFGDPAGGRLPDVLDLASPPEDFKDRITVIYGEKKFEAAGEELATGDFNGDGYPDLAIGALTATNPGGEPQAGAVHLIYWKPGLRGVVIDFQFPENFPPGLQVSDVLGLRSTDILGDTLSAADFNHDGFDDLAVGIPHETLDQNRVHTGEVAILFGRQEPFPPRVYPDLPDLPVRVAYVDGANAWDFLSYSMEARDYDGDGYADLFPNAMHGDGTGPNAFDSDVGQAYLLSGYYLSQSRLSVDAVEPPTGPVRVATPVVVRGSGFTRDEDTRVRVGGATAGEIHVISGTRLTCRVPALGAPGSADVEVETRYGSSVLAAGYSYVEEGPFVRGDSNGDLTVDLSDAILTLNFLFLGAAIRCPDSLDANDDGGLDISDPIYTLVALFGGGPLPPPPYPQPGRDPTLDGLVCPAP